MKNTKQTLVLQRGDVVMLKSGSPRMTIVACDDKQVFTEYFDSADLKEYWAHPDCFDKVRFPNA